MRLPMNARHVRAWLLPGVLLVVGVFLLLFPASGETTEKEIPDYPKTISDIPAYEAYLAHKIEQMTDTMLSVEGTKALVTMDGLAYEKSTSSYFGDTSGTRGETLPHIRGVAVICRGGGEGKVQLEIISMLTAVFDIPASAVYVGEKNTTTE